MTAGGIPATPVFAYAGTDLVFTFQLTAAGIPTDPTAGVMSYGIPGQGVVTVTVASLTHIGAGAYTYTLNTTSLAAGIYVVQIVATGAVVAVDVEFFTIQSRPLG